MSPFSAYGDNAGLLRWNPARRATILGLRYWNSDHVRTPPPQAVPLPRPRGGMLHCTSNLLNMHIVGLLRWKPSLLREGGPQSGGRVLISNTESYLESIFRVL